jgi:hypothetical protein
MKQEFSWKVFEKYCKISWKSVQWEPSCSVRTDRQTDTVMTKLVVAFRNFANAPKKRAVAWKEMDAKWTKETATYLRLGSTPAAAHRDSLPGVLARHQALQWAGIRAAGLYKHGRCDRQGLSVWTMWRNTVYHPHSRPFAVVIRELRGAMVLPSPGFRRWRKRSCLYC